MSEVYRESDAKLAELFGEDDVRLMREPIQYKNGHHRSVSPWWGRVLLAQAIEEGVEPPEELERDVLLKGRVHSIYAAAGFGKTWLMLWLVVRAVERGEKVVVFDAENGQRIVAERLAALGVPTEHLDELLSYYPFPNLTLDEDRVSSYKQVLDDEKPALVIFDSLVNFLGAAGLEENSNDDIVKWAVRYTRPARERGIAVLVLDHVPHENNHARGASRKKDEVDVMWRLTCPMPFDRDTVGRIVLHREKDREGWLPERVGFSVGGTFDGFIFKRSDGTIEEPDPQDGLTASERKALETLRDDFGERGVSLSDHAPRWPPLPYGLTSDDMGSRDLVLCPGTPKDSRLWPEGRAIACAAGVVAAVSSARDVRIFALAIR